MTFVLDISGMREQPSSMLYRMPIGISFFLVTAPAWHVRTMLLLLVDRHSIIIIIITIIIAISIIIITIFIIIIIIIIIIISIITSLTFERYTLSFLLRW